MCRMIAFTSSEPQPIAPYLAQLARLSQEGVLVERWERHAGGNHPDGWGVAIVPADGQAPRVVRSGKAAAADPALHALDAGTASRFIGHIRFASNLSTVCEANSHPFTVGGIVLGHNGTFKGTIGAEGDARGVSDSLVFLEKLAARWPAGRTFEGLADTLMGLLSDELLVGNYSAANFLLAEGGRLFVFRKSRRDPDYYALYLRETRAPETGEICALVVASERLDGGGGWRQLSEGELIELALPFPRSAIIALPF